MSWLSKILGYMPKEERQGIEINWRNSWEVPRVKDTSAFFKALVDLVPDGSVLYLEDGAVTAELKRYLEARKPEKTSKVSVGVIWPRPKWFHMEITKDNLYGLAKLAEHLAEPEIAAHLHVYKNDIVLLSWHDFSFNPFLISKEIPEDKVKGFCKKLNVECKECTS
jgi:hypothetical protein